jgi:hypothetical protein
MFKSINRIELIKTTLQIFKYSKEFGVFVRNYILKKVYDRLSR